VSYSNTGYVLLAMVVRIATGLALRNFAAERVFAPLGMTETRYRDDHRQRIPRLADGHVVVNDQVVRFESCFDRVGDGGVISTLADWAIWESTLLGRRDPWYSLPERLAAPFVLRDDSVSSWRAGVVVEEIAGSGRDPGSWNSEAPERTIEPDGVKDGLAFRDCPTPPVQIQPVVIAASA
jgi:CubicO group peptidase (beta-lactamase class C family)